MLQLFDGQMDKIRLQKLLFLFTRKQTKADYDFIPYKFGCFSYSVNADLTILVKRGILTEDEKRFYLINPPYNQPGSTTYLDQLKATDRKLMEEIKVQFGRMSTNALIRYTYTNFPFYAIKSEVATDILTREELKEVNKARPKSNETVLFTIGYEGISLEEYLTRLLKNDVKVLVDVRHNPLSMKYGFSKNQLKKYCNGLGIDYVHIPEVGIQGSQRRELYSQNDYDKLFEVYRKENLSKTTSQQQYILNLLKQYKRIALTCFEANICQCHRKHLAEAIQKLSGFCYVVKHI